MTVLPYLLSKRYYKVLTKLKCTPLIKGQNLLILPTPTLTIRDGEIIPTSVGEAMNRLGHPQVHRDFQIMDRLIPKIQTNFKGTINPIHSHKGRDHHGTLLMFTNSIILRGLLWVPMYINRPISEILRIYYTISYKAKTLLMMILDPK
jgi:hypothetical protein